MFIQQIRQLGYGSADALCRDLERNQVLWAIGFYSLTPQLDPAVQVTLAVIRGAQGRVVPLLFPNFGPPPAFREFAEGQYTDSVIRGYLQQAPLKGVGEIGLYSQPLQSVTYESPQMQTVFRIVDEMKGIVMIHPNEATPRPTDLAEIESTLRKYPNQTFLFHGSATAWNLIHPLMSKYPNVYYTLDAATWMFDGSWGNLMFPKDRDAGSAERFVADVNRVGVERIVEESLGKILPRIQQYPERILWGTDQGMLWHFDERVSQLIATISRRLIARLPGEFQERYAFRNALRVFGRFVPSVP